MKRLLLLVIIVLLCFESILCKTAVKRKKVSGLKKKSTKISKSPLEEFTELPPEDYLFLKELDKQFKIHGDRLKIKVERDNGTLKSLKRNIDGELGSYGYNHNSEFDHMYQFSQPKYMIYPYSQHDIPPAPATSYTDHRSIHQTFVDILPSKSFEIQESPLIYHATQEHYAIPNGYSSPHQHQIAPVSNAQYVQPVIVLRIPGPSKYASHLQTLLQQYIEIRAAQLIKSLEESEGHQHHNVEPNYQQNNYQQSDHEPHYDHHQQQQHFPPIEQVYQIKIRKPQHHQQQQHHVEQQQQIQQQHEHIQHQQQHQQISHQPDIYYESPPQSPPVEEAPYHHHHHQQQQQQQQQQQHQNNQYETQTEANSYDHSTISDGYRYQIPIFIAQPTLYQQPKTIYGVPTPSMYARQDVEHHHSPPQHHVHHHHDQHSKPFLQTIENSPRDTHTRVHFTDARNDDHSTSYPLPSVKTPTRTIYVEQAPHDDSYHSSYQHQNDNYQHLDSNLSEYQTEQPVVEITQRPFNYHAHRAKLLAKGQKRDATSSIGNSSHRKQKLVVNQISISRVKKSSLEDSQPISNS